MSNQKKLEEEAHSHLPHADFEATRVICIPIDSSNNSDLILKFAISNLINKETDQVVLLNVRPAAFNEYSGVELGMPYIIPSIDIEKQEERLKVASHELLKTKAKILQMENIHVRAISLRGEAREELTHKIESLAPDFVVVGSRGLSTFKRVLLGSTSEHLVHHLKVPVMVVPPKN